MFVNRGIYHKGWTAVTRHSMPWLARPDAGLRRRRLGAVRTRRLDAGARPREHPDKLAELQRLFLIEAAQVQRAAARRPPLRALQPRPRRPPAADQGQVAAALRRDGPAVTENSVLITKNKSHAVTGEVDVPEGRREGRDHRPGRRLPAAGASTHEGKLKVLLQLLRPAALQGLREASPGGRAPGPHGVHLRRRRPRQGRRRDALRRRRARSARAAWSTRCRWPSPGTRPPTSAGTAPPRSATTTGTGQRASRGGPLGPDRHRRGRRGPDHLIAPEERLRSRWRVSRWDSFDEDTARRARAESGLPLPDAPAHAVHRRRLLDRGRGGDTARSASTARRCASATRSCSRTRRATRSPRSRSAS